jgi:hypothetical protein
MITTTFRLAKDANACETRYRLFAKSVGGVTSYGRDKPITLTDVLDVCGSNDTLWCLKHALPESQQELGAYILRMFACDCAEHILHIYEAKYPYDLRPRKAIEASRKFAKGELSEAKLAAARDAARDARDAAWAAAGDAAWAAAGDAARAARDAAWAAWDAMDAEGEWQTERLRALLKEEGWKNPHPTKLILGEGEAEGVAGEES